jgi:hypothetical protein
MSSPPISGRGSPPPRIQQDPQLQPAGSSTSGTTNRPASPTNSSSSALARHGANPHPDLTQRSPGTEAGASAARMSSASAGMVQRRRVAADALARMQSAQTASHRREMQGVLRPVGSVDLSSFFDSSVPRPLGGTQGSLIDLLGGAQGRLTEFLASHGVLNGEEIVNSAMQAIDQVLEPALLGNGEGSSSAVQRLSRDESQVAIQNLFTAIETLVRMGSSEEAPPSTSEGRIWEVSDEEFEYPLADTSLPHGPVDEGDQETVFGPDLPPKLAIGSEEAILDTPTPFQALKLDGGSKPTGSPIDGIEEASSSVTSKPLLKPDESSKLAKGSIGGIEVAATPKAPTKVDKPITGATDGIEEASGGQPLRDADEVLGGDGEIPRSRAEMKNLAMRVFENRDFKSGLAQWVATTINVVLRNIASVGATTFAREMLAFGLELALEHYKVTPQARKAISIVMGPVYQAVTMSLGAIRDNYAGTATKQTNAARLISGVMPVIAYGIEHALGGGTDTAAVHSAMTVYTHLRDVAVQSWLRLPAAKDPAEDAFHFTFMSVFYGIDQFLAPLGMLTWAPQSGAGAARAGMTALEAMIPAAKRALINTGGEIAEDLANEGNRAIRAGHAPEVSLKVEVNKRHFLNAWLGQQSVRSGIISEAQSFAAAIAFQLAAEKNPFKTTIAIALMIGAVNGVQYWPFARGFAGQPKVEGPPDTEQGVELPTRGQ